MSLTLPVFGSNVCAMDTRNEIVLGLIEREARDEADRADTLHTLFDLFPDANIISVNLLVEDCIESLTKARDFELDPIAAWDKYEDGPRPLGFNGNEIVAECREYVNRQIREFQS